jgi:lipopolysaccharide transport system permease protein
VARDVKLRYKRSILGVGWSLLNPLAQLVVLWIVFQVILPLPIPNYAAFLFTGLLAWTWFDASLSQATVSIVENRDLVRRPGFPVATLPLVTVSSHLIHFVVALPVLLAFLLLNQIHLTRAMAALPLVLTLQFVLILSLAFLVASVHVRFRDTQYLLRVCLMLGFYLTPVFYDLAAVPMALWPLYNLNPMAHLIQSYRVILLHGQLPAAQPLLGVAGLAALLMVLGYRAFARASDHFAEEL